MISEVTFATRASSFWQATTPTSEEFVRVINSRLCKPQGLPIRSVSLPARRGLINETAFEAFVQIHSNHHIFPQFGLLEDVQISNAFDFARNSIFSSPALHDADSLSEIEMMEVRELVTRLETRFWTQINARTLVFRPKFQGCGIINRCQGDLYALDCLFEIKAGDRAFRSQDLRQILVYTALAAQKTTQSKIDNIEIFNPRLGISFACPLKVLCFEISGKSVGQLLFEIVEAISAAGISL